MILRLANGNLKASKYPKSVATGADDTSLLVTEIVTKNVHARMSIVETLIY